MALDQEMIAIREKALDRVQAGSAYDPAMLAPADDLARFYTVGGASTLSTGVTPAPAAASAPRLACDSSGPHAKAMTVLRALGRLPAKRDARVPKLMDVAPSLPPAPPRFTDYVGAVASWILGENDRVGDCTCVGPANVILGLTTLAGAPKRLPDGDIIGFYSSVTGYDPADPSTDTGAVVEDVLAAWHARGIAGDKLDGYATVDLHNHDRVRQAIAHLGPVDLGIDLPNGWMQATTWDVSTAGDGIAGGHCITAVGYTEAGPLIVSWGQVFTMTWAGWDAFVEEAHALLSRDAIAASGKDTEGVDWTALEGFMAAIRANP